jgi:hypothetical protein
VSVAAAQLVEAHGALEQQRGQHHAPHLVAVGVGRQAVAQAQVVLERHVLVDLQREAGLLLRDRQLDLAVERLERHVDALAQRVELRGGREHHLAHDLGRACRRGQVEQPEDVAALEAISPTVMTTASSPRASVSRLCAPMRRPEAAASVAAAGALAAGTGFGSSGVADCPRAGAASAASVSNAASASAVIDKPLVLQALARLAGQGLDLPLSFVISTVPRPSQIRQLRGLVRRTLSCLEDSA